MPGEIGQDIGRFPEIIHPEDRGKTATAWHRLRRGKEVSGECRLVGPAGEVHLITVKAFPLDPENSPPRLLAGFCLDHATGISSRQAEDALAWEAKVNAALSELSQAFINAASPEELSCLVLAKARELTGSGELGGPHGLASPGS